MFTSIIMFVALCAVLPRLFGLLRNLANNIFGLANNQIDSWFKNKNQNPQNPFDQQ